MSFIFDEKHNDISNNITEYGIKLKNLQDMILMLKYFMITNTNQLI